MLIGIFKYLNLKHVVSYLEILKICAVVLFMFFFRQRCTVQVSEKLKKNNIMLMIHKWCTCLRNILNVRCVALVMYIFRHEFMLSHC